MSKRLLIVLADFLDLVADSTFGKRDISDILRRESGISGR